MSYDRDNAAAIAAYEQRSKAGEFGPVMTPEQAEAARSKGPVDWFESAATLGTQHGGVNRIAPGPAPVFMGSEDAMNEFSGMARSNVNAATGRADFWSGQAQNQWSAPQAQESQWISNQEQSARAGDQAGAMQLVRERAMGLGPSEVAYQLQAGLDKSLAQQSAIAGSARGQAALAAAQGNAAAAQGNLQQRAFTEAGRLRAQEIANAQNMYGMLAGQQRAQDQARLAQSSQMAQQNAQTRMQYGLGAGQLAEHGARTAQQGLGVEMEPWKQQYRGDMDRYRMDYESRAEAERARRETDRHNAQQRKEGTQNIIGAAGSFFSGLLGS